MTVVHTSFEDFIYIILGLVWMIYSFYSAKKKQKAKKDSTSTKEDKPFLESIINEMGISTEQPEPIINPVVETDYANEVIEEPYSSEKENNLFSYDDEYETTSYSPPNNETTTKSVTSSPSVPYTEKSSNKHYAINKKSSQKRIDLRRAIIYSVILKKVYF